MFQIPKHQPGYMGLSENTLKVAGEFPMNNWIKLGGNVVTPMPETIPKSPFLIILMGGINHPNGRFMIGFMTLYYTSFFRQSHLDN